MKWWFPLLAAFIWSAAVHGAAGSWSGEAPPLRLAVADRLYQSAPLRASTPADQKEQRVTSIWWRYTSRPAGLATIELCRQDQCVPLPTGRGRTEAFAGWSLAEPFYFRAHVPRHVRQPVELTGLQLIVNYQ